MARKGFTIIEVALFLAVAALLMVGLMVGVSSSINRQHYNDSVQDFAEYLRNIYASVSDVQNVERGREGGTSNEAVYGKLLLIGGPNGNNSLSISPMTVLGKTDGECNKNYSSNWQKELCRIDAKIDKGENTTEYVPLWNYGLDIKDSKSGDGILFIRLNGVISAYYVFSVGAQNGGITDEEGKINVEETIQKDIHLCIRPDFGAGTGASDVRIKRGIYNSSAIEVLPSDSEENPCNE